MKKLVAVALGICIALITCGVVTADELVPAEWDSEAGPYLGRGTWAFSGKGTITVDGVTMSAVITNGIARIFSDGGAGLEIVNRIKDSGDVRYSHDGEIILEDSFEEDYSCDKPIVGNRLKLDGGARSGICSFWAVPPESFMPMVPTSMIMDTTWISITGILPAA